VNHAFERLGGYLYAATQTDMGVFSVTLPPESLGEAVHLFGHVIADPTFGDIEIEKGIVCEEILEDLDDEGRQVDADNLSRKLIYPTHPLGYTITGDEARVRAFNRDTLRAHHATHYTAANCVLALSGAVTVEEARALAATAFAGMPRGVYVETEAPVHRQKKARLEILENVSSQTELRVCFRAVPMNSPERAAMDMLTRIIDDGMSTRLYHRICDAKGLCYDVSASFDGYEDDGVLDFAAGVQHARTTVVVKEILDLLLELAQHEVPAAELEKARRRHAWELSSVWDSPDDLASYYAEGTLFGRFQTVAERVAANAAVTATQIREMAALLAQPSRLNVLAVGLLEDDEDKRLAELVRNWKGAT
jgi:predicted Zn-dependent peptidase